MEVILVALQRRFARLGQRAGMSPDARQSGRLSYPRVGVAGQGCQLGRQ